MPHAEAGVVATTRPLRRVLLPGLDATGSQHAAFCAAMRRLGVEVTVIAYPVDRTLITPRSPTRCARPCAPMATRCCRANRPRGRWRSRLPLHRHRACAA